jgi:uncharacterized protein (TIGR01777 family)
LEKERFEKSLSLPVSAEVLHDWHLRPGAFSRLCPPWDPVEIVETSPKIVNGAKTTLRVKAGPFRRRWIAEYRACIKGKEFTDVQIAGPFKSWEHRHQFIPKGGEKCVLVDSIDYELPLGFLGRIFGKRFVAKKLEATFRYRHTVTAQDLTRASERPPEPPLTILVTGASGLVGSALVPYLENAGHKIITLGRRPNPDDPRALTWDPDAGTLSLAAAGPLDAVIHLAGENIAAGRWSKNQKDRIFYSRKRGTRLLADALARLEKPPKVLVSASGVNYYEPSAYNIHTEESPLGTGFLSEVCRVWEGETRPAREAGVRVVNARLGVVLTPAGGALSKMLPIFKLGLGGRMGDGRQRMSWIALDDVIDVLHRAVIDPRFEGPVNVTSPNIVENREFSSTLGRVLHRPSLVPVPERALTLAFGEMARETVLPDLAVAPAKLKELGYDFRFPELESALKHLLGIA